jgi:putative membrane protein
MHSFSLLLHQSPVLLGPQTLWRAWNSEPALLLALLLPAGFYLWGTARCWRRAGVGRGIRWGQLAAFFGGMAALVAALLSPLDALSEALFSAHMVQHLLLLLVAPPLFVLARPLVPWLWALPPAPRRAGVNLWRRAEWPRRGWRLLTLPPLVWLLHTGLLWAWHTPFLYQAALRHEYVHILEHVCFFGAALLLWWAVLDPPGGPRGYGISILAVFLTALQGGILGALLTFSPTLWYPIYAPLTAPWGLAPLADQQLAGVIMWVPSGLVYLGAVLGLFVAWLAAVERGMRLREGRALDMQFVRALPGERAPVEGG